MAHSAAPNERAALGKAPVAHSAAPNERAALASAGHRTHHGVRMLDHMGCPIHWPLVCPISASPSFARPKSQQAAKCATLARKHPFAFSLAFVLALAFALCSFGFRLLLWLLLSLNLLRAWLLPVRNAHLNDCCFCSRQLRQRTLDGEHPVSPTRPLANPDIAPKVGSDQVSVLKGHA